MIGYVDAPRAWTQTDHMARMAGVNLPLAVLDGWLTRRDLVQLVQRCQSCGVVASCARWMRAQQTPQPLPAFCTNKGEIESLLF